MSCEGGLAPALHSQVLGRGPARVLALHCGLGQGGMWAALARQLDGIARLDAPDLPGHGRSPDFPEGADVHDVATSACRPFMAAGTHLLGHSFGATVALRLALDSPAQVASLTLVEPVLFAAARGTVEYDRQQAAEAGHLALFHAGDVAGAARQFNRLWGGGAPWDSIPAAARAEMTRRMPFIVATEPSLWQDCHGLLHPGRLEALTCPVLLLRGADSRAVVACIHRGLMDRLPHAVETVVQGAGHMLALTHAEQVARALVPRLAG